MVEIDILYLVDRLESLLNEGWRVPFTSNLIINEDKFLDIIDHMRTSIPEEVKRAQRIERERERIIA
ncbi:MAG TPA: ATPase, partial [Anaerolineae bacterium]|nr:ATPase [Anaerolineae bacterium]